jgi:hypothetical protein
VSGPRIEPNEAISIALTIAGVPHATRHGSTITLVLMALEKTGWKIEPIAAKRARSAKPVRIPASR